MYNDSITPSVLSQSFPMGKNIINRFKKYEEFSSFMYNLSPSHIPKITAFSLKFLKGSENIPLSVGVTD